MASSVTKLATSASSSPRAARTAVIAFLSSSVYTRSYRRQPKSRLIRALLAGAHMVVLHCLRVRTGRGYVWRMGIRVLPLTGDAGALAVMVASRDGSDAELTRSHRFATRTGGDGDEEGDESAWRRLCLRRTV